MVGFTTGKMLNKRGQSQVAAIYGRQQADRKRSTEGTFVPWDPRLENNVC